MKRMKKACLNVDCIAFHDKIDCTNTDKYCMKCGGELSHVCRIKGCYDIIESPIYDICQRHYDSSLQYKAEKKEKHEQTVNDAKKFVFKHGDALATFALPLLVGSGKLPKDLIKKAPKLMKKG